VARLNHAIANKPKHTADEELLALQQAIQGPLRVVDGDRHSPAVRSEPEADGLRNEALGTLGRVFSIDAGSSNAFSKLTRYESSEHFPCTPGVAAPAICASWQRPGCRPRAILNASAVPVRVAFPPESDIARAVLVRATPSHALLRHPQAARPALQWQG
jgi:hypothetical protein